MPAPENLLSGAGRPQSRPDRWALSSGRSRRARAHRVPVSSANRRSTPAATMSLRPRCNVVRGSDVSSHGPVPEPMRSIGADHVSLPSQEDANPAIPVAGILSRQAVGSGTEYSHQQTLNPTATEDGGTSANRVRSGKEMTS